MSERVDLIDKYLQTNHSEFRRRVEEQAQSIIDSKSEFSPDSYGIGLEREYYLTDKTLRLKRRDSEFCDRANCQYELGLHNVEFASRPCCDFSDIHEFIADLRRNYDHLANTVDDGFIVRDGCIGLSPSGETMTEYLSDGSYLNGCKIPSNMTDSPYYLMLEHDISQDSDKTLSHPNLSYERDGTMTVSLTTSIQPHVQVPRLEQLPDYFSACIRLCGPLTALSANSPYVPHDMYSSEPSTDPFTHENRITIQRDIFNNRGRRGVRLPKDVECFKDLIDRIASHELYMPILSEEAPEADWSGDSYEFNHQQRTTWWWVNPRIGDCADGDSDRAVRIELRPFSNQPTFKDNISLLLLSVGAVTGIAETNHPVLELSWENAYQNFMNAEKQGSDADLTWIDSNGETVTNTQKIIEDIAEVADHGLGEMGVPQDTIDEYLHPMRERTESPSKWKCRRYGEYLSDNSYESALKKTFQDYVNQSSSEQPFCEWD